MFSLTNGYKQMTLDEQISQISSLPNNHPAKFLNLLKEYFDLPTFIPQSFRDKYYASATNDREHSLESMLAVLILMHFFHFTSYANFIVLLLFSSEIRSFCNLDDDKVPEESVISKFKTTFDKELLNLFNNISLHVMNSFTDFNDTLPDDSPLKGLSEIAILDTTGIKPKVKENNPKTLASEIKRQSNYKKYLDYKGIVNDFNPYLAAYRNMPKFADANPEIKLDYANGHFGYFYKLAMITNGFGIPLHIHFLDENFYKDLPTDFESMEEQKFTFDNASLRPCMSSFLKNKGDNRFTTFLGDSEFDSYDNYGFLKESGFQKALIPINSRNSGKNEKLTFPLNEEGIPTCSAQDGLPFIPDGSCVGKNRSFRLKFVCPKSVRVKNKWVCTCTEKCRDTNSTVTTYAYPSGDLRTYFGVQRGSDEWNATYKKRTIIEREFSSLKSNPALAAPRTYNSASLRSDILLTAITKLIVVILAFSLGQTDYMSNLKKLLRKVA